MTHENDTFIMLPTVDICFKNLMENKQVRQGFIAALLKIKPEEIKETFLLPSALSQDYADDKLGILDVRVSLENGTQMDMEMQVAYFAYWDARILFYLSKMFSSQLKSGEPYKKLKKCIHVSILDFIYFEKDKECCRTISFCDEKTAERYTDLLEIQILELKKIPKEEQNEEGIIRWMRFLGGRNREELAYMAKTDKYLGEAYEALEKLSADERARLEYEAREKALRDYHSQMSSAMEQGMERGLKLGEKQGEQKKLKELILKKLKKGYSLEEIAKLLEEDLETIQKLAEEV